MHLTLSALYALVGESGLTGKTDGLGILETAVTLGLDVHGVVASEGSGDIDTLWTWHTIPAAGAAYLFKLPDLLGNFGKGPVV